MNLIPVKLEDYLKSGKTLIAVDISHHGVNDPEVCVVLCEQDGSTCYLDDDNYVHTYHADEHDNWFLVEDD